MWQLRARRRVWKHAACKKELFMLYCKRWWELHGKVGMQAFLHVDPSTPGV